MSPKTKLNPNPVNNRIQIKCIFSFHIKFGKKNTQIDEIKIEIFQFDSLPSHDRKKPISLFKNTKKMKWLLPEKIK